MMQPSMNFLQPLPQTSVLQFSYSTPQLQYQPPLAVPFQQPRQRLVLRGVTGQVKWFSPHKGYGLIERDDVPGAEIFVHMTSFVRSDRDFYYRAPNIGEKVEFDVVRGPRGDQAFTVTNVDGNVVTGLIYTRNRFADNRGGNGNDWGMNRAQRVPNQRFFNNNHAGAVYVSGMNADEGRDRPDETKKEPLADEVAKDAPLVDKEPGTDAPVVKQGSGTDAPVVKQGSGTDAPPADKENAPLADEIVKENAPPADREVSLADRITKGASPADEQPSEDAPPVKQEPSSDADDAGTEDEPFLEKNTEE